MKIEFIKDYRAIPVSGGMENDFGAAKGEVVTVREDAAKWLIDNGFAKEVEGSGAWKPRFNETYYFVDGSGRVNAEPWLNDKLDEYRYSVGECFKTEKAAEAWRGYRIAITTVRQDEGVLTPEQIYELGRNNGEAYHIGCTDKQNGEEALSVCEMDLCFWPPVGVILFDTEKHAQASLDKHLDGWKIIANYDWSRE